ncbi:MAG: protease inhibitor I42 family protein [Anaerolineae bacterium]|nr:protease inhibitor I42 family protein [Anaerolineae bacterium]
MKKRLTALAMIAVLVSLLIGGTQALASQAPSPSGPGEVVLTTLDNGQRVELRGSNVLVLNLEANPATGYSWQVQGMDRRVLTQVESEFVSNSTMLGAPATQVMRFQGLTAGQTEIRLAYARPWENAAPARTFSVQVQVTDPAGRPRIAAPAPSTDAPAPTGGEILELPSSYNWCTNGGCTPVRDQGNCGSCWAFGTVGPLESAILINDGASRDLSEQYLVSCNVDGWGCNGGWWAHDYHEWKIPPGENAAGAVYENNFPYAAQDLPCDSPYTHNELIDSWAYIGSDSSVPATDAIKQAILTYGPVSAAVCVDSGFQSYSGGVFNPRKPCNSVNHAIVLVGWDDSMGAWLLRNSWGTGWGENGYMWIAYGKSKVGYSANYVVYGGGGGDPTPTPTPTETPPPDGTMHVQAIDMWYTSAGPNRTVYTQVFIVSDTDSPVADATVNLDLTLPNGSVAVGSGLTGADGSITFSYKSRSSGTYVSEVTGVTHTSYTYDPNANVETSESLNVQ